MDIGERIRNAREKARLTQAELAELVETEANTISRWERGVAGMRAETISKIAAALKISVAYLLGEIDEPRSTSILGSCDVNKANHPANSDANAESPLSYKWIPVLNQEAYAGKSLDYDEIALKLKSGYLGRFRKWEAQPSLKCLFLFLWKATV